MNAQNIYAKAKAAPDGFVIIVNKAQRINELNWEQLNGLYEDFYIDWEKLDGSIHDVIPVLPLLDKTDLQKLYLFLFDQKNDEAIGVLTQIAENEEAAFKRTADTVGAVSVIRKQSFDDFRIRFPELSEKIKTLNLRRYSLTVKDSGYSKNQSLVTEYEVEKEKDLLSDSRFEVMQTVKAIKNGKTLIYFTQIKSGLNLTFEYLIQPTRSSGKSGGISGIIVNTFFVLALTLFISLPLGVGAAVYLTQFARKKKLISVIRFGIETLAGIPSIIFGLFGSVLFVNFLGLGFGLLSGALTLSLMILPTIIRTSEEAILAVPHSLIESSVGLGATRIETIRFIILPAAVPGIITGMVLGMGRAMGETAALLFTMGSDYKLVTSLFSSARSLSTHIYLLFAEGIDINKSFASATVLILFILIFNFVSKKLIAKMRPAVYG